MAEIDLAAGEMLVDDGWTRKWAETLERARTRPVIFLGEPAFAHRHIMGTCFALYGRPRCFGVHSGYVSTSRLINVSSAATPGL
jgi:hypothetical protein